MFIRSYPRAQIYIDCDKGKPKSSRRWYELRYTCSAKYIPSEEIWRWGVRNYSLYLKPLGWPPSYMIYVWEHRASQMVTELLDGGSPGMMWFDRCWASSGGGSWSIWPCSPTRIFTCRAYQAPEIWGARMSTKSRSLAIVPGPVLIS